MSEKLPQGFWLRHSSRLTDWHCHLGDIQNGEIAQKVLDSGHAIHHMSTTPEEFLTRYGQYSVYPQVRPSLGLYPLHVNESSAQVNLFFELLPLCPLIGEIGLDFSPHYPEPQVQVDVFKNILTQCHRLEGRCLSIHSRKAGSEVLDLCWPAFNGTLVLHWYSGPCESLSNPPEHLYFSINAAMLQSRHGRQLLEQLPKEKILLETDAPYLQKEPLSPIVPSLYAVVQSLALRWKISVLETLEQLEQNSQRALKNVQLALLEPLSESLASFSRPAYYDRNLK